MNYITEINRFYEWLETNEISDSAIVLWHALMHVNNRSGWLEEFPVKMITLQSKTGLSKSSVIRARKVLVDNGRIIYIEMSGQRSPIYTIVPFHTETQIDLQLAIMQRVVVHKETQTATLKRKKVALVCHTETQTVTDNTKLNTGIETKPFPVAVPAPVNKSKKESTLYWKKIVDTWFKFYKSKFSAEPTFSAAMAKNLKKIIDRLQKLSETVVLPDGKKVEWTEQYAVKIFIAFLELAYADHWMKDNFLLTNLYSKFDSIKNSKKDGAAKQQTTNGIGNKSGGFAILTGALGQASERTN